MICYGGLLDGLGLGLVFRGRGTTGGTDGVRDAIFANLHRGVTMLEARGGFTGRPRPMLYVVVGAHEVGRLNLRVAEVDPNAFVAISSAQEVFGEGFTPAEPEVG